MSYLNDMVRVLARTEDPGAEVDAGAELGNLLALLAQRARRGELVIEPSSRFAVSPSAAWMHLDLSTTEGLFVRLEVGKGQS